MTDLLRDWFQDCPGLIELRHLPSRDRSFHEGPAAAAKAAEQLDRRGGAVYFGVATRDGKGGKKENIVAFPGVWCDVDFKDTPEETAEKLLRDFSLRPTFINASGGGWHLYWRFKEPVGREYLPQVEAVLRGIASFLQGDKASAEAAHVLRPVGMLNRKYDPSRRIEVIESNPEALYNLSNFDLYADAELSNKGLGTICTQTPAESTPSTGPLLSADRLPAVIEGCAALSGIHSRAKKERHLGHLERMAVANLYSVFEGGRDMAMELFSTLSDFDPKYTAQQMASLVGKPPRCINEALCGGKEKCEVIQKAGGSSPIKLATWREEKKEEKKRPEPLCYETLNPTTAADLIASDIPDPVPLIDGLIYPETVLVVGGLVKVRKTWLAMLLALCLVSAAYFLGHAIRKRLKVLYIGGEGSDKTIRKRLLLAVGYIPGLQDEDLENLGIVSSLGRVKLDTPAGEEWLQRVSEGYDVVVADPYYRFLSVGSGNEHADQRTIFDVLDRLKAKGKAIVLVHHLRKPQGADAGAAELRGAGLDGYADSILLLSRKKGKDERFALKYVLRHDEEPDDLELSPHGPLFQVATPLPPKVTAEDLIAAIDAAGGAITGTALLRAAKDATEASKHETEKALAQGIKEKIIGWRRKDGKGQGRLYYVMARPTDAA